MPEMPALITRIVVAGLLGGVIGAEREYRAKIAGTRTHLLVAVGSALMMIVSRYGFDGQGDPARVAAQIVSGIGFLGAGAIIVNRRAIHGLTTAAGIWVDFEVAGNVIKGMELCGSAESGVRALVPGAINTKAMRVIFSNAKATLDVTGDQTIGGFITMTGGKITSETPSTVHFSQFDYSKNPAVEKPITNSAVVITGAVTLYKDEGGLFVQDVASGVVSKIME